ncbi:MAG: hypothetical protein ACRENP_27395 [Longimicrobiales bacterium]
MRNLVSRVLVLALLLGALPATAQQRDLWEDYDGPRRIEFAAGAGLFLTTGWSDRVFLESFSALGVTNRQLLLRGFSMAPEFGGAASVTYWKGRYGFRVQAGFVQSCVTTSSHCDDVLFPPFDELPIVETEMHQYTYGVQGIVGLTEYSPNQSIRPYVIVGAGGVTYDVDQPLSALLPGPLTTTGPVRIDDNKETVIVADPTTLLFSVSEGSVTSKFAFNLGIGTDLRAPIGSGAFGFRFEASDQIAKAPLSLRVVRLDGGFFTPWGCTVQCDGVEEIEFNDRFVHSWRLSASIFVEFGVKGYRRQE